MLESSGGDYARAARVSPRRHPTSQSFYPLRALFRACSLAISGAALVKLVIFPICYSHFSAHLAALADSLPHQLPAIHSCSLSQIISPPNLLQTLRAAHPCGVTILRLFAISNFTRSLSAALFKNRKTIFL
eukprot:GHVT01010574.1.p1 GENE.GHVT01010574.1~~GHVT01010574.1.p1  ORF type:complete len:131 (+),score=3.57 GHVT01010574.1:414-806(+)